MCCNTAVQEMSKTLELTINSHEYMPNLEWSSNTSPWTCNPIGLHTLHLALLVSGEVQVQVQFISYWDLPIAKFQRTDKIIFITKPVKVAAYSTKTYTICSLRSIFIITTLCLWFTATLFYLFVLKTQNIKLIKFSKHVESL